MPFVWRDNPENRDLLWLAMQFGDAVAEDRWDSATDLIEVAVDVSRGAFVLLHREDGGCRAMTRDAQYCSFPRRPGDDVCAIHARLIDKQRRDQADA